MAEEKRGIPKPNERPLPQPHAGKQEEDNEGKGEKWGGVGDRRRSGKERCVSADTRGWSSQATDGWRSEYVAASAYNFRKIDKFGGSIEEMAVGPWKQ